MAISIAIRSWPLFMVILLMGSSESLFASNTEIPHPDLSMLDSQVRDHIKQAIEAFEQDVESTVHERRGAAFGALGQVYHAYEFYETALTCYHRARQLQPEVINWIYLTAQIHRKRGSIEQAAGILEEVLAIEPRNLPAVLWLGELSLDLGREAEAEAFLRKALEIDPNTARAWFLIGHITAGRGQHEQAVDLFEQALALQPNASIAHYPLAKSLLKLGRREEAKQHLDLRGQAPFAIPDHYLQGINELRTGFRPFLLKGASAMERRDFEDAVRLFKKAYRLDSTSAEACSNLGAALRYANRPEEALTYLVRSLGLDGQTIDMRSKTHTNIGLIEVGLDRLESGIGHLQEAVEYDPMNFPATEALAIAMLRVGRYRDAIPHLESVTQMDPKNAPAIVSLAGCYYRAKRYRECLQILEAGVDRLPDHTVIQNRLAQLLAACPDDGIRDGLRARALADALFRARPSPPQAITLAMALAETGEFELAIRLQEQALAHVGNIKPEQLSTLEADLESYKEGQPCRRPQL